MVSPDRRHRLAAQRLAGLVIGEVFRRFKHRRRIGAALAEIAARPHSAGRAHGLPGPLIVSLTSYPARFGTLALTLKAILRQSVRPDEVILWLDEGDDALLPLAVRDLPGLSIRICPRWRSYKKIVPTLLANPDAYIVTADDDVYYPRDWLAGLVDAAAQNTPIACHRAHRVALGSDGLPLSYRQWSRNIGKPERSELVFLTGVMGVIYAPGVFHSDVVREDLFTRLAPKTDDVWLYWMHRLTGVEAAKICGRARILEWEGSQAQSLRAGNLTGDGNDRAVRAMLDHFGWPGSG